METVIHLDTHVAVWLYMGSSPQLKPVWSQLTLGGLTISPIVILELKYLAEAKRMRHAAEVVIDELVHRQGLRISTTPFSQVVQSALSLTWTRDPFDRLIVANAIAENARLVTKDEHIRKHFRLAVGGSAR